MDLQHYVERLQHAESELDVNRFVREGLKLWPLYRVQAVSMFRNPASYFSGARKGESAPWRFKQRLLAPYYAHRFLKEFRSGPLAQLAEAQILFYCKPRQHLDQVNGKYYDRFLDPFYELLPKDHKVLKLQLNGADEQKENHQREFPVTFFDHRLFRDHFFYLHKGGTRLNISGDPSFETVSRITGLKYVPSF